MGIRVEKFSIGFGPALFSWRSRDKEVLYVIAAIPLGGYVKMLGENPDEQGSDAAPLSEEMLKRAYHMQPIWKRAAVAVAGPLYNFLFAIAAYMVVGWLGQSVLPAKVGYIAPSSLAEQVGMQVGDRILMVDDQEVASWTQFEERLKRSVGHEVSLKLKRDEQQLVVHAPLAEQEKDALLIDVATTVLGVTPGLILRVDDVMADSPAEQAGLHAGDVVEQVNGEVVTNIMQFIAQVQAHAGQRISVIVKRDGTLLQLELLPKAEHGKKGRIGVRLSTRSIYGLEHYSMGFTSGVAYGFERTWEMTVLTLGVFTKMVTSAISPENLGGPIAIAQMAGKTADMGLVYFIGFLALISVNLGVLNLLPVPILDGGHLAYLGLEKLYGKPLSERFLELSQMLGLVLIVSLMVFAFYNDISRLFRG